MTLFDDKVDVSVKSPNIQEWEAIAKQLKKNVTAAKRAGDAQELKYAIEDYDKHYRKKTSYLEAGIKQLSIFDV